MATSTVHPFENNAHTEPFTPAPVHPAAAVAKEPTLIVKTVVSMTTERRGSVLVINVLASDGKHYFVKVSHNQAEIGGTQDWNTGELQP